MPSVIQLESEEPPSKKGRYEKGSQRLCYRCLEYCGNTSKHCRVAIRDLSNAAPLGNWLRVAKKNK